MDARSLSLRSGHLGRQVADAFDVVVLQKVVGLHDIPAGAAFGDGRVHRCGCAVGAGADDAIDAEFRPSGPPGEGRMTQHRHARRHPRITKPGLSPTRGPSTPRGQESSTAP